jgi:hypothetical protein
MTPLVLLLAAQLDPTLPEDVRPVIEQAVKAELDPKRGSGNAVEILKAETPKFADPAKQRSIELRKAAIELRRTFLSGERFPVPIRWEQALSTFAHLELSDPGLEEWIDETLKHHEYAKKRIGTKKQRVIKVAILTSGGLDKDRVAKPLIELVKKVGFQLAVVPAKEAGMVITASAKDAPPEKNLRMVRVQLGIESIRDGKVIWRKGVYRTEGGIDADEAIGRALTWLAKVGGRDLFFRWIGETAFHTFVEGGTGPGGSPHGGEK